MGLRQNRIGAKSAGLCGGSLLAWVFFLVDSPVSLIRTDTMDIREAVC